MPLHKETWERPFNILPCETQGKGAMNKETGPEHALNLLVP